MSAFSSIVGDRWGSISRLGTTFVNPLFRRTAVRTDTKLYQQPSLPSWEELSQQKSEALRSLSNFHDGKWICDGGAISSDASGNNIMRSAPFESTISTRIGVANRNGDALKLVETISWKQNQGKSQNESSDDKELGCSDMIFGRVSPIGSSLDIDSVDGSYSVHPNGVDDDSNSSTSVLPQSLSGIETDRVTSIVEHCLVASETERVRCFLVYGKQKMQTEGSSEKGNTFDEQRLIRVVISHEHKADEGNKIDDLIRDVVGSGDDRLNQLSSAMSGDDEMGKMKNYPINMLTLSLGPWLGDAVIRERSFNSLLPRGKDTTNKSSKGFGGPPKQTHPKKMGHESGFGEWVLGVQKLAMTFKYDFDSNVRQTLELGKSMGVFIDDWPKQSSGVIYDDRMSRRIKSEDRSMFIDFNDGGYCGFIFGSVFIKASRFLTPLRQGSQLPMLTEFAIFQKAESSIIEVNDSNAENVFMSRITRLYDDEGNLKTGCTSFFTLHSMDAPLEP